MSNGTGQVARDRIFERTISTLFNDLVHPRLNQYKPILGTRLEPVWLFPIALELKKKGVFKGELTACNTYLHNLKALKVNSVEVQRSKDLKSKAVKIWGEVPIVWMTGHYQVKRALLFGFIPAGSSGDFNIDLKRVDVAAVATLNVGNDGLSVDLDQFEIGFSWKKSEMKFDSQYKHLDRISDFLLNKVKRPFVHESLTLCYFFCRSKLGIKF